MPNQYDQDRKYHAEAAYVLQQAHRLLNRKGVWIRDDAAMDENGAVCEPWDEGACRFCVHGALLHLADKFATGNDVCNLAHDLLEKVCRMLIADWNKRTIMRIEPGILSNGMGETSAYITWNDTPYGPGLPGVLVALEIAAAAAVRRAIA